MQYNYVHDFTQSQWADYQIGGLYLDEGTTGYTVAHNVFADAPTSIFQNKTGTNTLSDNGGASQSTISSAGIVPNQTSRP
jgi:spore coat protein U-like protein